MIRDDVCYLVAEAPAAHGIFDKPIETERMVYCTVRSVSRSEYYRAMDHRLRPSIVFVLQFAVDYHGEKIITWQPPGELVRKRYNVLRTYRDGDALEIVCEEATADA